MSIITYKGFKPFSYQRAVINEVCRDDVLKTGKLVVCKSSRQKGKSYMIANILLWYAINYRKTRNIYIGPTLKLGKELFKTIVTAIIKSGVVKSSNATDLSIVLINGSSISFKSAEQKDNLRGYTVSGILCIDEAAYISDEVYDIIKPWTDFYNAPTLICSTPFTKTGFFYKYFCYGLEHSHNTVSIDWCDEIYSEDIQRVMPPARLEEYRNTLPSRIFRTDYLGEWIDEDGALFTGFKQCVKQVNILPTDRLFVGIDWSNQGNNDDTVLSIFNQSGNQVLLKYFNDLSPLKQIDCIYDELNPILKQIVCIQPELNSLGTPYSDMLKARSQLIASKVKGFNTTNKSKDNLVGEISVAFEKGDITILPDEKQLRQLSYYTATYNPITKNVSYNAPQGLNDDIVIADMLGYDAYKNGSQMGVYALR